MGSTPTRPNGVKNPPDTVIPRITLTHHRKLALDHMNIKMGYQVKKSHHVK